MLWKKLKIETLLEEKLTHEFGVPECEQIYGDYTAARKCLIEEILPEIKAIEPKLTSHGPDHVADVLKKIYYLLGKDINEIT
ncbi:MAG: hypothetical protein ACYC69_08300 [Thermodesulfovibrionales bacterium]